MNTLFELKTKIAIDMALYEHMKQQAIDLLSDTENGQYTQAVVLRSVLGNAYGAVIQNVLSEEKTDEASLLQTIREANDTEVLCALCMWCDRAIDIPSHAFRKQLVTMNPKNADTLLFVMTADGVSGIKLSTTMK
jgi:hypothetical protein